MQLTYDRTHNRAYQTILIVQTSLQVVIVYLYLFFRGTGIEIIDQGGSNGAIQVILL